MVNSISKMYLTESECAAMTGLALSTLRNWRFLRQGIPYCRIGKRSIRYALDDVIKYMESRKIQFSESDCIETIKDEVG